MKKSKIGGFKAQRIVIQPPPSSYSSPCRGKRAPCNQQADTPNS